MSAGTSTICARTSFHATMHPKTQKCSVRARILYASDELKRACR